MSMLPSARRTSTKDFYACGARVQIPSIKVTNEAAVRHKTDLAVRPKGVVLRRRHTVSSVGDAQRSLRSHVGLLKQTLTFTDDVISSRSPQSVSYRQARKDLSHVFHHVINAPRRYPRVDVGRHNCRGDPRKHPLCHLNCVQPTAIQSSDRERVVPRPIHHPSPSVLPSDSVHHSRVVACPSHMLYRDMRVVPASKSVQWEEEVLKNVTSSTAIRLRAAGGRRGGREGEGEVGRGDVMVERGKVGSVLGDEVEVEKVGSGVWDYVMSLERGAKPLWRRGGRREVITLDNDATFSKVQSDATAM